MFRAMIVTAVGVAGLAWWAAGPSAAEAPTAWKIAMPRAMFRDTPPELIEGASIPFRELIRRQVGVEGQVEMAADHVALADRLKAGTAQVGVFHGFEYAWVKQTHPGLVPLAVTVPDGRTCRACLVVNAENPAERPADLNGACVAVPTGLRGHGHLFYDRLRAGLAADRCQPAAGPAVDQGRVLDGVVLKERVAAVVDHATLNWYADQKPGNFKHLKVLARSEELPPAVIAYQKGGISDEQAARLRTALVKAHQSGQGRTLLLFWNLKGFSDLPADFDTLLEGSLKAYPPPVVKP